MLTVMSTMVIAPALPQMAQAFAATPDADLLVRLSITTPALAIMFMAPLAGWAIDRLGRLRILYASMLLYSAAGVAGYFLDSLPAILVSRLLLGVAIDGTLVIDGVVGDYLCEKFGSLFETPLTLRVKDNRLVEAFSDNKELENDFWKYTHTDENSDRVGEFAIGTNIELKQVIGHILQDEKFPGIHIAFGNPYGVHTGADWFSSTHIDVVATRFDIWVDDRKIMDDGKFLID